MTDLSSPSRRWPPLVPFLVAFAAVVAVDQVSKIWALEALVPCVSVPEPRTFDLCLAFNQGMAFSLGAGSGPVIAAVAVAIVVVLGVSARTLPGLIPRILMGVVAGGAIGNVIDRAFRAPTAGVPDTFLRGAVVDFFYTSFWPTFNVADACIVVGGILLAIQLWRLPDDEPETISTTSTTAP